MATAAVAFHILGGWVNPAVTVVDLSDRRPFIWASTPADEANFFLDDTNSIAVTELGVRPSGFGKPIVAVTVWLRDVGVFWRNTDNTTLVLMVGQRGGWYGMKTSESWQKVSKPFIFDSTFRDTIMGYMTDEWTTFQLSAESILYKAINQQLQQRGYRGPGGKDL